MKKTLIVAAITAVSIASVNTALAANDTMYVGASYDMMKFKAKSKSYNSGNVTLRAGQDLTENFGVEAVYGFNDNDSSKGSGAAKTSYYIKNYYGLYVTGRLPVAQSLSLTSKLGYVRAKGEAKFGSATTSDTGSSVSWGVGAAYTLVPSVDLTLDYTSIYSDDYKLEGSKVDVKARGFMFGAKFTF